MQGKAGKQNIGSSWAGAKAWIVLLRLETSEQEREDGIGKTKREEKLQTMSLRATCLDIEGFTLSMN